jgi:hypothetical protein
MANPIQFWLKFNNGAEVLWFPVNPPSIKISGSNGVQDITVNGLGEYTVFGDPKLREFSFSSFFPRDYNYSYCEYSNLHDPWYYVNLIEKWIESRRPCRLIVTGTPINIAVTIRDFSYDPERGGCPGDIYFDISLKEYVFVEFKRVTSISTASASVKSTTQRPSDKVQPKTYKVVSGDSLWKIAQRIYGDGSKQSAIYAANKAKIGKDPNFLVIGMELVIP